MRTQRYDRPIALIVVLLIILTLFALPVFAQDDARSPHSLVIVLDGVRPDLLLNMQPPAIESLIDGSWWPRSKGNEPMTAWSYTARDVEDANPNSGPNHASIMTGVLASRHGAFTNSQFSAGVTDIAAYPHYLDRLESHYPQLTTVFLASWDADFTMITQADYRRMGQGGYGAASIRDDRRIAEIAVTILSGRDPETPIEGTDTRWEGGDADALFVFFDSTDAGGHTTILDPFDIRGFYPFHPDYIKALMTLDGYIARMLDAIVQRPTLEDEDWQIILTTDHGGFLANHGYDNATTRGVWFMISSSQVTAGELPAGVHHYDTAVTVLSHFSYPLPTGSLTLDGVDRGFGASPAPSPSPESRGISRVTGNQAAPDPLLLDADGFTLFFPLAADPFRYLKASRPLLTLQDRSGELYKLTIRDDHRFWVGIGGRLGNKEGGVTPDTVRSHWVRTLGAETISLGESGIVESARTYGLLPELNRETLVGIRVDGSGVVTLFGDRSDGYLYSVSGTAITGVSALYGTPLEVMFGESPSSYVQIDAALPLPEIHRLYREGQLSSTAP